MKAWTHPVSRAVAALGVVACVLPGCQRVQSWLAPAPQAFGPAVPGLLFDAADVLPDEQLRGAGYAVARRVPVVDHDFMFRVETEFGAVAALGRNMLELRLHEVRSIEQAAQIKGVRKILKSMFGALGDTVAGAETLLTDPIGSIERAPKGLDRMVRGKLDPASRRAGGPARRQLALTLDCDPETRNPILRRMLNEIELQRLIGRLPVEFIPYTGILRLTTDIKGEVASTPPHEINQRIENELAACGVAESVRRAFCKHEAFTTVERLVFMTHFRNLGRIGNREALIELAVDGDNEADALGVIEVGQFFASLHGRQPIARLERRGWLFAALQDGRHVIYAPHDCIVSTRELENAVASYRAGFPSPQTTLICSGRVMPDARRVLEAARITVEECGPQ